MSLDEGIKSTDVGTIKAARGIAKGQVTKNVTYLRDGLVIEDGKFLFTEIDDKKIQEHHENLEKAVVTFQDLHERYIFFYTEKETDPEKKKAFHEEQNIYRDDARKDYNTINRSYIKYKKSLEEKADKCARDMKVAHLLDIVQDAKIELDSKKEAAATVIESTDESVRSTANILKEELIATLANYKSKVTEYKAATIFPKDSQVEEKYAPAQDVTNDIKEVDKLKVQLSAIVFKTKVLGESISNEASSNSINAQSNKTKTEIARLQKLSCPKFSGSPREYGRFKREFCELVNVPGRSNIEIGKNRMLSQKGTCI